MKRLRALVASLRNAFRPTWEDKPDTATPDAFRRWVESHKREGGR